MKKINIPFQKHSAYQKLITKINEADVHSSIIPVININGVAFTLHNDLIEQLKQELSCALIYCTRDSKELRRYLDTLSRVNLSEVKYQTLINIISNNNFSRVAKIDAPGEYVIKGDNISFWAPGYEHPIRVSFFGDDFEKATIYDEIYGKTYEEITEALVGNYAKLESNATQEIINIVNPEKYLEAPIIIFSNENIDNQTEIQFDLAYAQLFFKRFDLLEKEVQRKLDNGYVIKLFTKHKKALPVSLREHVASDEEIESGFESNELKILYLTDRELFGTVFLSKEVKQLSSKKARQLLANLEGEIEIGDYVVHEDHGIGTYQGIKQEIIPERIKKGLGEYETVERKEDYLLVEYAEGDELYVPLSQIDKITKYISPDELEPRITRLSKTEWIRLKAKVKESVEKLARELVQHYAKREVANAPEILFEDSSQYNKFADDFPYQETPDQQRTEKEIMKDLQTSKPMSRLIVGDVGFGKTEVAMRAAFKVAENGYQVAVLCPTTVLASQHEKVFEDRFQNTDIKIAGLSRFNADQYKEILNDLEEGKVQIIVGTHRLLSNDVNFKKLGLLIIDEEQKFGVKQKEKIKKLEYGVHVLSMSATPIPRTLSMALSAVQDISIIQTPPEGRKATKTIVTKASDEKIAEAILNEVNRGGQVYFVHNRVRTINSRFAKLSRLIPGVRFAFAHGQMSPETLEKTINDFYNKKFDCLICTTIIENGIDMPNVNTIVIEHAQHFGLGQLYQLRGRVGRSTKQAYAYI
ncbi:DEAD/DEAH box helicase, partial [Candidatus Dojkabacteria bacterium]|nr:DEAD/DEAH box helicase [Candidatus Dojkabacteria bacterium]